MTIQDYAKARKQSIKNDRKLSIKPVQASPASSATSSVVADVPPKTELPAMNEESLAKRFRHRMAKIFHIKTKNWNQPKFISDPLMSVDFWISSVTGTFNTLLLNYTHLNSVIKFSFCLIEL